jgi:putative SbcD/Mre11-related phosphoesterase
MSIRVLDDWLLTPFRLAIHEPSLTAVVADVHLGYREARQQAGEAVPLLAMRAQLAPLRRAHEQFGFRQLLVAGDLFERAVHADLLDEFLGHLQALGVTFTGLVPGNHDRGWDAFHGRMSIYPQGVVLGRWRVVHGDVASTAKRLVLGHWHPVVHHQGRRLPCYLVGPQRLVLPAFSADAAGQPVAQEQHWHGLRRYGIVAKQVIACQATNLPAAQRKTHSGGAVGFAAKQSAPSR